MMNHDNRVEAAQSGNGDEIRLTVRLPSLQNVSGGGNAGDEIDVFTALEGDL
jgi:hypothetical protein